MKPFNKTIGLWVISCGPCWTPSSKQRADQTEPENCGPWSEVMTAGTPNLETQTENRASAQALAVVEVMGTASTHLVDLISKTAGPVNEAILH